MRNPNLAHILLTVRHMIKEYKLKGYKMKIKGQLQTCNGVRLAQVKAISAKDAHPVPFVHVCYVVMDPHEFRSVFPRNHMSLMSITAV